MIFFKFYFLTILISALNGKKFGQDGPFVELDVHDSLATKPFFDNYVKQKKAVLLKNSFRMSPATYLWTDEYLMRESEGYENVKYTVETVKKENRNQNILEIPFNEFLENYKKNDLYLVNQVPEFLKKDIIIPQPLQCEHASHAIDQTLMWLSAGDTSSVTHTDDYENILCVISGRKDLILVDYNKFENIANVIIDIEDGSYSSMDVDNVDVSKFPGIENLEYYSVSLNSGDCIYIPFRWIHQVRSYNRNIAVNFWFNYEKIFNQKFSDQCSNNKLDKEFTLDKFSVENEENELNGFKYFIIRQIKNGNTKLVDWKKLILREIENKTTNLNNLISEFFNLLDFNGNGEIELDELELERNTMEQISDIFQEIDTVVKNLRLSDEKNDLEENNNDDDDEVNDEFRQEL